MNTSYSWRARKSAGKYDTEFVRDALYLHIGGGATFRISSKALTLSPFLLISPATNEQVRGIGVQIAKDTTNEERAKLLMTMLCVDHNTAMVLLSEIGDVTRFASHEKLVSKQASHPASINPATIQRIVTSRKKATPASAGYSSKPFNTLHGMT